MKRLGLCMAVLMPLLVPAALAQTKSGVDRFYILSCGEGVAGDISRWSGVDPGKSMDFADNCYLIHHAQGWICGTRALQTPLPPCPMGERPTIRAPFTGIGRR